MFKKEGFYYLIALFIICEISFIISFLLMKFCKKNLTVFMFIQMVVWAIYLIMVPIIKKVLVYIKDKSIKEKLNTNKEILRNGKEQKKLGLDYFLANYFLAGGYIFSY